MDAENAMVRLPGYGWQAVFRQAKAKQGDARKWMVCMFYVYLLRSIARSEKTYVGFSELTPQVRLNIHNAGSVKYTSKFKPWEVVAFVAVRDNPRAVELERYFKSGSGHEFAHRHLW
jgi:predicted GIY-YIG superfamily endonuclease